MTDAERGESVEYILRESERLGRLIDNVLESSRLVARKQILDLQPVDLRSFLDTYFSEIRPRVTNRASNSRSTSPPRPPSKPPRTRSERVLTNLIDNALRYSGKGGRIRCRADDFGGWVSIQVEDEGEGIPKSELSRIFDRFYQIGRDRGGSSGTGLGLFIVSQLVEQMNGSVRASSHDDRPGAVFVVELPIVGGAPMTEGSTEDSARRGRRSHRPGPAGELSPQGLACRPWPGTGKRRSSWPEAKNSISSCLDVRLPIIDGFEVCQRLRAAGDLVPILMLTAKNQPDDMVYGLKLGADDYVTKPFDLAVLLARVEGLLRRSGWARATSEESRGAAGDERFDFGEFWVDFGSWQAATRGGIVELSRKEIAVMRVFANRPGQVVSRRELLAEVWGLPDHPNTRVVDNVILSLRKAFEESSLRPRHIHNVRGVGYRFEV